MNSKETVINWHVTERCNYRCKHCFAKWNRSPEIWEKEEMVERVISNIEEHFRKNSSNPIRLNIVGGEPLLFPERLWNVVKAARLHGMDVSLVTNGTAVENARPFMGEISQIGLSIDSLNHRTNLKIGRCCEGETLSAEAVKEKIQAIRRENPHVKIKVNTVVNAYNCNEVLTPAFADFGIDKWKILRQMPFGDNAGISDYQFYVFVKNNCDEKILQRFRTGFRSLTESGPDIYIEDNCSMTESYLMISPDGRLFQNGGREYGYSRSLAEVPFAEALQEIRFDEGKFRSRYGVEATERIVGRAHGFFHIDPLQKTFENLMGLDDWTL